MAYKPKSARKTKKELMVEIVREAILSGELEPGTRLLQEELAERFDVSPTPVREAIQQLVAEGVLSHSPYKGVQVAEVTLTDVREIYLLRAVLEALATELAVPNLKISEIQGLRTLQAEIEAAILKDDVRPIRKLNYEFHMRIYTAAEMPQLIQLIKALWIKSPWDTIYVLPGRPRLMLQEHQRVIEAMALGQAEQAGQHMREHIEIVQTALIKYLDS